MEISIANEFTEYPGLRHCDLSDHSGEEFYHKILNQKFYEVVQNNEKLTINLDHTTGYAPSFLDEAFGNLVYDFSLELVNDLVVILSTEEPYWKEMITKETFIQWEKRRKNNDKPKITKHHEAWYRKIKNNFEKKTWDSPKNKFS